MQAGGLSTLGATMIVAAGLGMVSLLFATSSAVSGSVRLDDHETSWPDHIEVQDAGVAQLEQLAQTSSLDVDATRRKDRSTILVEGSANETEADIDTLIGRLVQEDARARYPGTENRSAALELELELVRAELETQADSATDSTRTETLATSAVEVRAQLATETIRSNARSRFIALSPAERQTPPSRAVDWVATLGLALGGIALVGWPSKP